MRSVIGVVLALLLLLTACGPSQKRSGIAPLAAPDFNAIPLAKREAIRKAWNSANDAPEDESLNGKIGMVLLAFHQTIPAISAFERASALSPEKFAWHY